MEVTIEKKKEPTHGPLRDYKATKTFFTTNYRKPTGSKRKVITQPVLDQSPTNEYASASVPETPEGTRSVLMAACLAHPERLPRGGSALTREEEDALARETNRDAVETWMRIRMRSYELTKRGLLKKTG